MLHNIFFLSNIKKNAIKSVYNLLPPCMWLCVCDNRKWFNFLSPVNTRGRISSNEKKNDITCVDQCSQWRRLAEVSRFQSRPRKADQTHWSKVSFWVEALENCCSSGTGQKNATEPIERWHFWSQNSGTVLQSAPVA